MRRKIPCFCENTFVADVPEEINLDADPHYIEDIVAGNFLNFTCSSCGKRLKPEFPLTVRWQSKNAVLEVLPELDRGEFYRRAKNEKADKKTGEKSAEKSETVIGYPELSERVAVLRDGFLPDAVEAIKHYLFIKADESYPESDISIWYQGKDDAALVFHLHGVKKDEVAVMKAPLAIYEKTLADFERNPKAEPFSLLRFKGYCSIQNELRPDELK
jgi:hypothetical protein